MTISFEQQQYFERELTYVRQSLDHYAEQHPKAAQALGLNAEDPDINRLIDAMALLMANTQHRLDQQLPQISSALLKLLYPAMQEITPSFACLKLTDTADEGILSANLQRSITIPKGCEFAFKGPGEQTVQFVSTCDVRVNPYQLTDISVEKAPFHRDGPIEAHKAEGVVHITLTINTDFFGSDFGDFHCYLDSDKRGYEQLIDIVLTQCLAITVEDPSDQRVSKVMPKQLQSRLCDQHFQILPYGKGQFSGLDMLRDYLAFTDKSRFFAIKGLGKHFGKVKGNQLTLSLYLRQLPSHLLHLFDNDLLALNVIPVLNRFATSAEPVHYDFSRLEVPVCAEADVDSQLQIINIDSITHLSDTGEQPIAPLFSEDFADINSLQQHNQPLYSGIRWHSEQKFDSLGRWQTLLSMSLDDKASQQSKLLLAQLWCCQGNLPCTLKPTDVALPQQEVDIPGQLVLATNPTAPRYPSFESNAQWQLVKLLGGTLSDLLEHPAPEHALKNILQLAAAKDYCELTNDIISVSHKQGVRPVTIDGHALFVTGNDIDITLSPDSHIGVLAQLLNGFYQQFCRYDRYIKVTVHQLGLNDSTLDFPLYTPWDE